MIKIKFLNFGSRLLFVLLIGIILSGCRLRIGKSDVQGINEKHSIKIAHSLFYDDYGVTHYTRYDMEKMLADQDQLKYKMPHFKAVEIKNLTAAKDQYHFGEIGQQLDVWDSWPLKNNNGEVANFHGYNIIFALTGNTNTNPSSLNNIAHSKIYMFYQKISNHNGGVSSWHSAGPVFKSNIEGAQNPSNLLKSEVGEWAGSTVIQKDGRARLFYTSLSAVSHQQTLTTALIKIVPTQNGLTIDHQFAADRKLIFGGDSKYYETLGQSNKVSKKFSDDDHCLRDPNYVKTDGYRYLVFEADTGSYFGKVGFHQLKNAANIGGSVKFQKDQQKLFRSSKTIKDNAASSNGAIGILELNDNNTVKKVMKPLVVFNGVNDEAERPSIVHYHDRWYLFTTTHGFHMISEHVKKHDSFMLGFSSNQLTSSYQPLNKNGLVLHSNRKYYSRTYSYSYGVIQNDHDPFVVNSYMSKIANKSNGYTTFAPSVLLSINGNRTNVIQSPTLSQGQLTYSPSEITN